MTEANNNNIVSEQLLYIHHLFHFWKKQKNDIQALINFVSKVNAIILIYALKLGFKTCYNKVRAQKIDDSIF